MSEVERRRVDAVVVGAGTSGSAAAYQLARCGLSVVLLEARSLQSAGARWVNAVPPWMFDRAGLPRPRPPEGYAASRFTTLSKSGRGRVTLGQGPAWPVDIRQLTTRLQELAQQAGVEILDFVQLRRMQLDGGRPAVLGAAQEPRQGKPRRIELRARLFVDAAGTRGALRTLVSELDRHCPPVPPHHTCFAAQEVCEVADRAGAKSFLERHHAQPGQVLAWTGVEGGFSTSSVTVSQNLDTVDLLTGSIDGGWYRSCVELIREIKQSEPWVGRRLFGGAGAIPLRRPYDRLAAPGIALLGDAGCQVFPAHGSGTGSGLIAARLLADAVTSGGDPGSNEATWAYQTAFQREVGAVNAAYDVLRRLAQAQSSETTEGLLLAGVISEGVAQAALDQRMPSLSLIDLLRSGRAALGEPRMALRFGISAARMAPVHALYRRYPSGPDLGRLARWSRSVAWLFAESPDVGSA